MYDNLHIYIWTHWINVIKRRNTLNYFNSDGISFQEEELINYLVKLFYTRIDCTEFMLVS